MKILSLCAMLLAAVGARAQQTACVANPDLDAKAYALWIGAGANPDAAPCAARLLQASCAASGGMETRTFVSSDGRFAAFFTYSPTQDMGVTVTLQLDNAAGVGAGRVTLATYPYRRAFYQGVGADDVQIFDDASQTTRAIGGVMLIPVDALTSAGQAQCP